MTNSNDWNIKKVKQAEEILTTDYYLDKSNANANSNEHNKIQEQEQEQKREKKKTRLKNKEDQTERIKRMISSQEIIIDYVLVYSLDAKETEQEALNQVHHHHIHLRHLRKKHLAINRKQNELRKKTPKETRVKYRKIFINNLKCNGILVKKVIIFFLMPVALYNCLF